MEKPKNSSQSAYLEVQFVKKRKKKKESLLAK